MVKIIDREIYDTYTARLVAVSKRRKSTFEDFGKKEEFYKKRNGDLFVLTIENNRMSIRPITLVEFEKAEKIIIC